jgi:hypothetical protein
MATEKLAAFVSGAGYLALLRGADSAAMTNDRQRL